MVGLQWLAVTALFAPAQAPEPSAAVSVQPVADSSGPAEGPTVAVQWTAPPRCPGRASLQDHIVRLAPARFAEAPVRATVDLHVDATITTRGDTFVATTTLRSATSTSTREFESSDCGLLARAVGVVVAVGLDPIAVATQVQRTTEPQLAPAPLQTVRDPEPPPDAAPEQPIAEPKPVPTQRFAAPVDRPAPPPSKLEYGARAGLGLGGLILPEVGVGLTAAPFIGSRRFHAQLALEYWTPRSADLRGTPGAGAAFQLATVGARGCPILATGHWRFPLCAGFDVGVLAGTGEGSSLASTQTALSPWAAIVLQPGFEVTLSPFFGVWAAFEGAISLNRPRYHLDNGGPLHRAGAFGPRGLVGIVLHNRRTIP